MQLPLLPYPVPPPPLPTMDTIFREQIFIAPVPMSDKKIKAPKEKKALERQTSKVVCLSLKGEEKQDLLPPPIVKDMKPLTKHVLVEQQHLVERSKPVINIEYQNIPLEKVLTREDLTDVVKVSVQTAVEEYKKWVFKMVEYEEEQWALRSAALQKAKSERDGDRIAQEAKAKAIAKQGQPLVEKKKK
jgi:hypothetical protein